MLRRSVLGIIGRHVRWYSVVGNQNEKIQTLRTPVAEELVSQFGNYRTIQKMFKSNPNLEDSNICLWNAFTSSLAKFGFRPRDCFRIINLNPSLLGYEEEKLEAVLNEWRKQSHLVSDELKFLIINRPEFLEMNLRDIKIRIPFLLNYCKSKDSLMTLLFLCPNIMQENWNEIISKMEFLHEEMVVYRTEVLGCRALSKSLRHIKLRFSILEKCGLYIRPNPYQHKQTYKERLKLNNPKLKDITDKSDYSFARKIAKISLEEYEVYDSAFNEIKEEINEDNDDDDDVSDSSDEE